jgi:transcriptional regulator with XRE-family HTH domain
MPTLQQLREFAVLTQAELAEEVGVSVTTISHWENGSKRPRASNIRKLAKVFHVSPQEVLAAIRETTPNPRQP